MYTGAAIHGVNKQHVAPGELGEVISLDLGMVPEEVVKGRISLLIDELNSILREYEVYTWTSWGYIED